MEGRERFHHGHFDLFIFWSCINGILAVAQGNSFLLKRDILRSVSSEWVIRPDRGSWSSLFNNSADIWWVLMPLHCQYIWRPVAVSETKSVKWKQNPQCTLILSQMYAVLTIISMVFIIQVITDICRSLRQWSLDFI